MNSAIRFRLVAGGTVLLFLAVGLLLLRPAHPAYPAYVSFSPNPNGTKAVAELLGHKQAALREWRKPTGYLPEGTNQALILIEPYRLQETEQEELLAWVEKGNDLLVFQTEPDDWSDIHLEADYLPEYQAQPRHVDSVLLESGGTGEADASWRLAASEEIEPLLSDQVGILAGRAQVGTGSVSLFLVPDWLTNSRIQQHQHFELIWPDLVQDWSVVWIDEYHHGYQERPGILAIYPDWLVVTLTQLAFALLFWIWWQGKRFGPVYTRREWIVRRGDETLLAIASWYEKRRLANEALHIREAHLRQLLFERWGLHLGTTDYEIVRTARNHWTEQEAVMLSTALGRLEAAKKDRDYTPKRLVQDSRLLDEVTKRLEKE